MSIVIDPPYRFEPDEVVYFIPPMSSNDYRRYGERGVVASLESLPSQFEYGKRCPALAVKFHEGPFYSELHPQDWFVSETEWALLQSIGGEPL